MSALVRGCRSWEGTWKDMTRAVGPYVVRVFFSVNAWTLQVKRDASIVHRSRHDSREYAKKRGVTVARGLMS